MKIRTVEAKLFHADGHSDEGTQRHDEANSRFLELLRMRLDTPTTLHWTQALSTIFLQHVSGPHGLSACSTNYREQ
jgi:hypothetical protein